MNDISRRLFVTGSSLGVVTALAGCGGGNDTATTTTGQRVGKPPSVRFPRTVVHRHEDGTIVADSGDEVVANGSDAATVINAAIDSLPSDRKWREWVSVNGDFTIHSPISYGSYTGLNLEGSRLTLGNGIGSEEPMFLKASGSQQTAISGGYLHGNKANLPSSNTNTGLDDDGSDSGGDFGDGRDVVHGVQLKNFSGDGIHANTRRSGFSGITVHQCDRWGVSVSSTDITFFDVGVMYSGNVAWRVGGEWAHLIKCYGAQSHHGMQCPSTARRLRVIGGFYENNNKRGISLTGCEDALFDGVQIIGNGAVGAYIDGNNRNTGASNSFVNCRFAGNTEGSFNFASGSNHTLVRDCKIEDSTVIIDDSGTNNVLKENEGYVTENSGTETRSGDGSATSFSWEHGLGAAPTSISVNPGSADAAGMQYVTTDATNITVNFEGPPVSGTSNLTWYWDATVR